MKKVYILDDDIEWLKNLKRAIKTVREKIDSPAFQIDCYLPDVNGGSIKTFTENIQKLKDESILSDKDMKKNIKSLTEKFLKELVNSVEKDSIILCDIYWCKYDESYEDWDCRLTPTGIYIRDYLLNTLKDKKIPVILISKESDIEKLKEVLPYGDFIFLPKRLMNNIIENLESGNKAEAIKNYKDFEWILKLTSAIYEIQFFSTLKYEDFLKITDGQEDYAGLFQKLYEGLRSYSPYPYFTKIENLKNLFKEINSQGVNLSKHTLLLYIDRIDLTFSSSKNNFEVTFHNCFIVKGNNSNFSMEHYENKNTYIAPILCGWSMKGSQISDSLILFLEFDHGQAQWNIKQKISNGKVEIKDNTYDDLCKKLSDSTYTPLRNNKQGKELQEHIKSVLSPMLEVVRQNNKSKYKYYGNIIVLVGEFYNIDMYIFGKDI